MPSPGGDDNQGHSDVEYLNISTGGDEDPGIFSDEDLNHYPLIETDENDEAPGVPPLVDHLTDLLATEGFLDPTGEIMTASKAEVLLGAITIANRFNLPQSAIAALLEWGNCFVRRNLVPQSRYMVDEIFNRKEGISFHAVCIRCKVYVREFERGIREVICEQCNGRVRLDNFENFFITFDVTIRVQRLLAGYGASYNSIITNRIHDYQGLRDIYDGRKYKHFLNSLSLEERRNFVTLTFNTDGTPAFKSSKTSL